MIHSFPKDKLHTPWHCLACISVHQVWLWSHLVCGSWLWLWLWLWLWCWGTEPGRCLLVTLNLTMCCCMEMAWFWCICFSRLTVVSQDSVCCTVLKFNVTPMAALFLTYSWYHDWRPSEFISLMSLLSDARCSMMLWLGWWAPVCAFSLKAVITPSISWQEITQKIAKTSAPFREKHYTAHTQREQIHMTLFFRQSVQSLTNRKSPSIFFTFFSYWVRNTFLAGSSSPPSGDFLHLAVQVESAMSVVIQLPEH